MINTMDTNTLKVKYEFLNQTKVVDLIRPVKFEELCLRISTLLNDQHQLILHYTSPTKEIFGAIVDQRDLDQIVQCVDRLGDKDRGTLNILVTTHSPSLARRPHSPPPGCLFPQDHGLMQCNINVAAATHIDTHVEGKFIPEDEDPSTSQSDDSSYFSSHQSLHDINWGGSGRRTRLSNNPPFPELLQAGTTLSSQSPVNTVSQRILSASSSNAEDRQTFLRRRRDSDQSIHIISSGQSSSINSVSFTDDCDRQQISLDKTIVPTRIPSLIDYKKGPLLGHGAFGQVFKCLDVITGREFAMKEVLLPEVSSSGLEAVNKEAECLQNEINIYTDLPRHQRIVQYFGTMRDARSMHIFMEYMAGGSVKDQMKQYGPLPPNIVLRYSKQILQGLHFLHQTTIIHRDIKAANILRDIDGNVKLSDFGTSRYLKSISVRHGGPSADGGLANTFCGTFFWMAPEVIRGEPYSVSADIWSLGSTIVEMLTGHPPFHDLEPYAALFKIANSTTMTFEPPLSVCAQFQTLIDRMFVPSPLDRHSADSLLRSDFLASVTAD